MPWRSGRVSSLRSSNNPGNHYLQLSTDGVVYRFNDNNWESLEAMVSVAAAAKQAGAVVYIFESGSGITTIFWA
jgi:hypothetical protein